MSVAHCLVETRGLTKRYRGQPALEDCSLEVRGAEIFGLLGPNGAGKTTLLRLLMGFLRPTAGWAKINGLDCTRQPVQVHRQVAYLPGDARLYRHLRGGQLIRLFAQLRGCRDARAGLQLARRLELDVSRRVGWMSTGMRQKLALAITLAVDAPVLILDEPTTNLDPTVRTEVLRIIQEHRQQGRTVLLSSHVLSEVEEICDRVAILRQGRLVHTQVMAELRRWHRMELYMDSPLTDVPAAARVCSVQGDRAVIEAQKDALPGLLRWMSALPIREMAIQPIGLKAVYDRFHDNGAGA